MTQRVPGRAFLAAAAVLCLVATAPAARAQVREERSLRYRFASVGIVPGQSLRVTVANLSEPPDPDAPPNPAIDPCWKVLLVDADGKTVADSGDIELPPGRTRTFTIERRKLARAGESRTGRLQVRAIVVLENDNPLGDPPEPVDVRTTVEVLNSATGHTMFGLVEPPDPESVQ